MAKCDPFPFKQPEVQMEVDPPIVNRGLSVHYEPVKVVEKKINTVASGNSCKSSLANNEVKPNKSHKLAPGEKRAYQVVYGRYKPYKKNKEWSFDGFLFLSNEYVKLYSTGGKM